MSRYHVTEKILVKREELQSALDALGNMRIVQPQFMAATTANGHPAILVSTGSTGLLVLEDAVVLADVPSPLAVVVQGPHPLPVAIFERHGA